MHSITTGEYRISRSGMARPLTRRLRSSQIPSTSTGYQAAFLPSQTIQISDRPVTGAGGIAKNASTASIHSKNHIPSSNRQVQDSNYFIGLLRNKYTTIENEIHRMKERIVERETEKEEYKKLEASFDILLQEVKDLEGSLADYNMTTDKSTIMDPNEIVQYQTQLMTKNKQLLQEVDTIFLMKQNREKELVNLQDKINSIHLEMEKKIQSMEPDKIRIYKDLINETHHLHVEGKNREMEMEKLRNNVHNIESSMRGSNYELREKYKQEEQRASELKTQLNDLYEDMKLIDMNAQDRQTYLLDKVKQNQAKSSILDQEIIHVKTEIKKLETLKGDIQSSLQAQSTTNYGEQSYEKMMEQDKEMTELIISVEKDKSDVIHKQNKTKASIELLLKHLSSGIASSQEKIPTKEEYLEIKDEASFKERHLKTSEDTMRRLEEQKVTRINELQQIENLDEKITSEQNQLCKLIDNMKKDILRFDDISGYQSRALAKNVYLDRLIREYKRKINETSDQVKSISYDLSKNKKSLEPYDEMLTNFDDLQQKLKNQAQNIFCLQEFIATKGRESEFETHKKLCLENVENLNGSIIEKL